MIEDLISISTLMICTFLSTMVVGIFMLQVWLTDRRHAAAGYWCLSMWIGSLCTLLFTLRPIGLPVLTVGIGNMLAAFAYAFMWAGFRVFDRRPVPLLAALAGPVVWSIGYFGFDAIATDVNNRVILTSLIIAGYSVAISVEVWRGRREERLPTREIAAIFFATHGIIYFLRVPMAIVSPAELGNGTAHSAWFAVFTLELFAHTILAAVAMLVLIKERGEALYRKASRTDTLTGIANRGSFMDDVQAHLARSAGGTLMIFDLDRFKAINDTYGHAAGDAVLKRFSARIASWLQGGMLFCRFGGEEFALFAPQHDMDRAQDFAEMLRQEVAAMSIVSDGHEIGVSVSIGLADVATFGVDFDRLHSAADRALYAAKEGGRNRVVRAGTGAGLGEMADRMRAQDAPGLGRAASR